MGPQSLALLTLASSRDQQNAQTPGGMIWAV